MAAYARSYLYVPADQPAKLAHAPQRGADALIIDLEDAVVPSAKSNARKELARWLAEQPTPGDSSACEATPEIWVRVNRAGTDGAAPAGDLEAAVHPRVAGIIVPKCDSPTALSRLAAVLAHIEQDRGMSPGTIAVAVLIETAAGIRALGELAGAPRVVRFQIGEADLVAALGMHPGPDAAELLPLRLAVVVASAAGGLHPPVGPVETQWSDLDQLRRSTEALRRLGFAGRAAVHPAQVPVINEVFTPSERDHSAAQDVLERFDSASQRGDGVTVAADGSLIDEATIRSARAVVDQWHRYGARTAR